MFVKRSIVCLLLIFISCKNETDYTSFALIEDDKIILQADSVEFKNKLSKNLNFEEKVDFDKIEIIEKKFKTNEFVYYILLQNFEKNIKVARLLEKKKNKLFINDSILMFQLHCICVGKNNCFPSLIKNEKEYFLSCTENPYCKVDDSKSTEEECIQYNTVVID
ncbi:MAG: hypothetical protein ACOVQR_12445 [Flavobacterium sp.]|jgi:hypothetical protein|uniref:hypothetical protein n=1 Tax=Flavobacterium sp. TaxID=239 RepID=UPI003BA62395